MRLRIPLMRGLVSAPDSPTAEQPRALAPSHGPAVAPAPEPAAEPLSSPPAAAPRTFEFGDPNVGLDGHPLAGYHGGLFYVRNRTDYFRLFLRSRLHLDSYNYFGPGVKHTDLKSTMVLRRARVEIGGELMGHWQWEFQMEAGPTGFSNATGRDQTSAAPAGTDPTSTTATYGSPQGVQYSARPIHAYVNYRASDAFNIKLGQFNVPFTAENRTSTNQIPFMERALPTRAFGVPLVKDIGGMIWGHTDKRMLFWSWAVMQGEGENRPNADNRALTAMRVFTRPLARGNGPLELLQLGASFKYAMHDKNRVAYDYPAMSTQSGYRFWSPSYTDSVGSGRRIHIIPSGAQVGVAGELRVPYDRFDLRSEFVYLSNNTREGVDGFQSEYTERFGKLKGYAYHATLSYCLLGKPFITGNPGDRQPPRLQLDKTDPGVPPHALELLVKWEQLNAKYESASRGGQADSKNVDGDIRVNVISAGVNYWASRHLRLTLNYGLNMFPDSAATSTPDQRAKAPGNRIAKGIDDEARESAQTLHELAARVAIAF
jgi:phosphate-selective porin